MKLRDFVAAAVVALLPSFAYAQTGCQNVIQNGTANVNDPVKFAGNCMISPALGQAGNALFPPTGLQSSQGISRIDILNANYGLNLFSNNNSSAFNSFQLGFVGSQPTINVSSIGGLQPTKINVVIGGVTWTIPPAGLPSGVTSNFQAQVHQNGGGTCTGLLVVCLSNQNMDLFADHISMQTDDASEIRAVTPGGTKTSSDVIGLNWTIAGILYQIRYTIQAGDTWPSGVMTNLAACIQAGGAANCTVTGGFVAALANFVDVHGIGYRSQAQWNGSTMVFDAPWGLTNSVSTFTSPGATETLSINSGVLDNGPFFGPFRYVPAARSFVAGDQLASIQFGAGYDDGTHNFQFGIVYAKVLTGGGTPTGEVRIGAQTATSLFDIAGYGNGMQIFKSDGTACGYPGLGNVQLCGTLYVNSGSNPQADFQATSGNALVVDLDTITSTQSTNLTFRPGGISSWIVGTQFNGSTSAQQFNIANQLTNKTDFAAQANGDVTIGEISQLIASHLGNVQVTVATTPTLTLATTGANQVQLNLVDQAGGQATSINFQDGGAGTTKYTLGKDGSNNLVLTDAANSKTDMQIAASGGALTFGPGQDFVFGASGGLVGGSATGGNKGSGTINVTGCFVNNVACGTASLTLSGDVTGTGTGTITTTVAKVNGVAYGTSPSTNTVPVVTGANTVTYETIPNAALAGSIAASKLVGSDIATLGTVTAGTWNGTVITGTYGGTGVNNGSNTLTLAGNLTTTGTGAITLALGNAGATLTFQGTDTYVGRATTDTLTNKTLTSATLTSPTIGVPGSSTGSLILANSANSNTLTLQTASIATLSRTITFPDPGASDSVVYLAATQTLTNKSLTSPTVTGTVAGSATYSTVTLSSPTLSGTVAGANTIPLTILAQIAGGTVLGNASSSTGNVAATISPTLGIPSTSTGQLILANSSTANTLTLQSASVATASRTVTFPDPGGNDSVVFLAAAQTLTNKTLSGNVAGTPTFTGATITFQNNIVVSGVVQTSLTTWADNQSCTAGQFVMDTSFVYVCTGLGGTSNVKRATLATF